MAEKVNSDEGPVPCVRMAPQFAPQYLRVIGLLAGMQILRNEQSALGSYMRAKAGELACVALLEAFYAR